jgi:hypothetical protein
MPSIPYILLPLRPLPIVTVGSQPMTGSALFAQSEMRVRGLSSKGLKKVLATRLIAYQKEQQPTQGSADSLL